MTGDPVTPFLVESWSKGLLAGHEQEAYAALRANATGTPPADSPYNGRTGSHVVRRSAATSRPAELGTDCVVQGRRQRLPAPGVGDARVRRRRRGAGADGQGRSATTDDAAMFAERGQQLPQPLGRVDRALPPAAWPTAPGWTRTTRRRATTQFHEGGAYQYQWLVPQDPAGLVGAARRQRAPPTQRLDDFFAYDKLLADPAGTARTDWVDSAYDYYGATTYNPNNEPDLLAPYTVPVDGAAVRRPRPSCAPRRRCSPTARTA